LLEGGTRWVVLHGVAVPSGYAQSEVDIGFQMPALYPDQQIDMAWFSPALGRTDGKPIPSTNTEPLDGKGWQRWSRHRTAENPWRPNVDNITTHLAFVRAWLELELRRN